MRISGDGTNIGRGMNIGDGTNIGHSMNIGGRHEYPVLIEQCRYRVCS